MKNGSSIVGDNPLSNSRAEIVLLLKKRGSMTADDLAELLHMTAVGVRAHLTILDRDGIVACTPLRRRMGRPAHLYSLTEAADDLFPKNYDSMAVELLEHVQEEYGAKAVESLLRRRSGALKDSYRERLAGKSFREQLEELTRILDETGYMPTLEERPDGSFELSEGNCALSRVARRFPATCMFEHVLFEDLLGKGVEIRRVAHMIDGALRCSYVIREREKEAQLGAE